MSAATLGGVSSPGPTPTFGTLLEEIILAAGSVDGLASLTGVKKRTLTQWRDGKFPISRVSGAVEDIDSWARRNMSGSYPPPGLPRGLIEFVRSGDPAAPPQPAPTAGDDTVGDRAGVGEDQHGQDGSTRELTDDESAATGSSATDAPGPGHERVNAAGSDRWWTRPALLVGGVVIAVVAVILVVTSILIQGQGVASSPPGSCPVR